MPISKVNWTSVTIAVVGALVSWQVQQLMHSLEILTSHLEVLDRGLTAHILDTSNRLTVLEEYEKLQDEKLREVELQLEIAAEQAETPPHPRRK